MDPVQAALTAFLNAVQAAQPQAGTAATPQAALSALVGQDLTLLFQGSGDAGLLFKLPSGQTLSAQGDFPFPPGTQVTVRVSDAGGGAVRLQTLQAQPPAPPPILAPLTQGEGFLLQARLAQAGPEDGLSELAALFRSLAAGTGGDPGASAVPAQVPPSTAASSDGPVPGTPPMPPGAAATAGGAALPEDAAPSQPPSGAPVPASPAAPGPGPAAKPSQTPSVPLPAALTLAAPEGSASSIPPSGTMSTGAPGPPPPRAQDPQPLLPGAFAGIPADAPSAEGSSLAQAPAAPSVAALAAALGSDRTPSQATLQGLLRALPPADLQAVAAFLRPERAGADPALVQDAAQRIQAALAHRSDVPAGQGEALVELVRNLVRGAVPSPDHPSAALPHASQAPASPDTWENWIRSSVRTLSDPAVSPREAPFHLAQAREGTALFEIPLPWAPQSPLQMWVESDRQGREKGKGNPEGGNATVLLGLSLSTLGETRLGIAKGSEGLRVRVWAENPEGLMRARSGMEAELKALGTPVDLKILPLQPGPGGTIPSLRSLAAGSTFQVLG